MQSIAKSLQPWRILGPAVVLLLVLAVACGGAAQSTSAPPPEAKVTPAPEAKATLAPEAIAQPTAVPAPTSPPVVAEPEVHPGKVTWMIGDLGTERFDYAHGTPGGSNNYLRLMQGLLLETNEKSELIPGIATDWGVSSDGLTWTVTIRDGVKYHDGTVVTAEDVRWTWWHSWSPESGEFTTSSSAQTMSDTTARVEPVELDKVRITTKSPDAGIPFQQFSAAGPSTWGILPKRDSIADEAEEQAYDKNPIGTGFLRLVKHVPAAKMEMERFDDYYFQPDNGFYEDRRVKFTSLDLLLVPEEATRVAAMRAGEADIVPVSLQSKKQVEAGDGRLMFGPEGVYFRVLLAGCWKVPDRLLPCDDQRVRLALAYAMDKETLRDALYGPEVMQVKGWGAVTPSTIGYSPDLDPRPFDPDKARQLLAEAGYKTSTNPQGKEFPKLIINTWVSAALPLMPEAGQFLADVWKRELGIDTELRVGDSTALRKAHRAGELDGQVFFRDNEARLDAAGTTRSSYGLPDSTRRFHNDQELFDLVQGALAVFDLEERPKALNKLYQRLFDEAYMLNLGYINIPWAVGPRILTWEPYPLAFYPTAVHKITLK